MEAIRQLQLSVVICTWNRAAQLEKTLIAMTDLIVPEHVDWELLVVNNNCTDHTDEVLQRFAERLPLRVLHEPTPGKSHALNLALQEARGQYLVFTDDDVLVDSAWLAGYAQAIQRWPEARLFGGMVTPAFEGQAPDWLTASLDGLPNVYALCDFGERPRKLDILHMPVGANMAVHRDVHMDYEYDPSLGPRPSSEVRGEETTMMRRMIDDGVTGWWVPEAKVAHCIPRSRQTTEYVRRWAEGLGIKNGRDLRLHRNLAIRAFFLCSGLVYTGAAAGAAEVAYRIGRRCAGPAYWVRKMWRASWYWGIVLGLLGRNQ